LTHISGNPHSIAERTSSATALGEDKRESRAKRRRPERFGWSALLGGFVFIRKRHLK
jgi:hypothetical protein